MAFEIAIKATEKEIERLEKRKQAIQDKFNKFQQLDVLFGQRVDLSIKEGELQRAIEFHNIGIEKLTARKLTAINAQLASVIKEGAEVEKILNMDFRKESDKQFDIEIKIDGLRLELIKLNNIAKLY